MLNLIQNKLFPWLLLIIGLSMCYTHGQKLTTKNQQLQTSNKQLQEDKQQLIEIIDYKNNELIELNDQYQIHQQKLLEQKIQLQDVNAQNRQYQQQLEWLIHENEQIHLWSTGELPTDIKRLYTRPEIKNSADYQNWLSSRHALLSAHE
ncbi:hypothetical protein A9G11_03065 [Gilliamella sp. wkB108]|uniref:hypothetical protein n=1 Tax=Gilliamella sp. wkB108 TaxID=3120256 RepID=UPI00080D8FBC|nr:hypothetical protein [Gilliamella apicola]OCG24648.1 hypothetical protein A9G11_03065 [Gilliamella apicola]